MATITTISTIAINNVTKGANADHITNAVKYARCGLDISLTLNKISAIERKIKKLSDAKDKTDDDLRILDGLTAECDTLKGTIVTLEDEQARLITDYERVVDSVVDSGNSEYVAKNLLDYYASEGSKKYYAVAFTVDEDALAQLRTALDDFWGNVTKDGSRHEFTQSDYKVVKAKIQYILATYFSLTNDGKYFTRKPVKKSNELVRALCDMYIQSNTSILRKNSKGVKCYDGIRTSTLVKDGKNGTNYTKLLASVVDLFVLPQYTRKYEAPKSDK